MLLREERMNEIRQMVLGAMGVTFHLTRPLYLYLPEESLKAQLEAKNPLLNLPGNRHQLETQSTLLLGHHQSTLPEAIKQFCTRD